MWNRCCVGAPPPPSLLWRGGTALLLLVPELIERSKVHVGRYPTVGVHRKLFARQVEAAALRRRAGSRWSGSPV